MRRENRNPGRPERGGLAFLFGLLILGVACGGGASVRPPEGSYDRPQPVSYDPNRPPEEMKAVQTPAEIKAASAHFETYVEALKGFGGRDPAEWTRSVAKLRAIPEHFWKEEAPLTADAVMAGEAGAAARIELARRGRVYDLVRVFGRAYDPPKWEAAWGELKVLGTSAYEYLGEQLLQQLMSVQRRGAWDGVRYYLVELGDVGLELTAAFYAEISKEADAVAKMNKDALFVHEEMAAQVLQVLIAFGDKARPKVREAGLHRNLYLRRASARAIGASADPTCLPLLSTLAGDVVPEVRAVAYEGMGRMRYAKEKAGEAVLAGLSGERESVAREQALTALGDLRYRPAVPTLLAHLDAAEAAWNRCMEVLSVKLKKTATPAEIDRYRDAMNDAQDVKNHYLEAVTVSLMKITGVKKRKPADWRAWWAENAATWR